MKEILLFKCSGACFRYVNVSTVLMFFYRTVACLLMLKNLKMEVKGWKLQSLTIKKYFLPIYNAPSDEDRQN